MRVLFELLVRLLELIIGVLWVLFGLVGFDLLMFGCCAFVCLWFLVGFRCVIAGCGLFGLVMLLVC